VSQARPGLQVFVQGIPVELLWRVSADRKTKIERWRAKRLFVAPEEIDVEFCSDQPLHGLHTKSGGRGDARGANDSRRKARGRPA